MKSLLKASSALALSGAMVLPALAGTEPAPAPKDLKKVIEDQGINYVETAQKGITLSGYVDTSYTENFGGRGTAFGGGQSLLHQFDVNNNSFNINAVKIALEKALPDKNEWAAGFRIDTIYGQDARFLNDSGINNGATSATIAGVGTATANVNNTQASGLALEQALVKFRVPIGNGLDIYAGKFVTFLGYEVIESPANPNFSRGLLFTNAIPLVHTGAYADYKFNDTVEAKFGIVDGWNNSTSAGGTGFGGVTDSKNDYPFGGKAITGQLTVNAPGKNANITQSFIYSPSGSENGATDNGGYVVYDIWGNWSPTFIKDSALTLGFNIDFGYNGASGTPNSLNPAFGSGEGTPSTGIPDSNTWWGAALYAQYKLTKVITLAARAEYLHSDAALTPKFGVGGATGGVGVTSPLSQDDWSETLTVSFAVWDNLLTRIEYRADVLSAGTTGTGQSQVQNEISAEAVYSF